MKKVITSNIAGSTGQPVKSGTIAHLQSAYQEAFQIMMQNIYGITSTDTTVRVLYGCINSGGSTIGTTCNISAGAVYYNGELYFVPAASFVIATGLVAVISTVPNSTNFFVDATADPVTMTDLSTPYVHSQFKVTIVDGDSTATGYIVTFASFSKAYSSATVEIYPLTTTEVTSTGGAVTVVTGGLVVKRSGDRIDISVNNSLSVTVTGTPSAINISLAPFVDAVLSEVFNVLINAWDSTTNHSCWGVFGSTLTIAKNDGTNFAAGTYVFRFAGSMYFY